MHTIRIADDGLVAEIWTLGAAVNAITMPGSDESVVLGHPDAQARLSSTAFLGEVVGPLANRVEDARFDLDGVRHQLEPSESARHTLHSGNDGFHRYTWDVIDSGESFARLGLDWYDTTGDHPGPLRAEVEYRVAGDTLSAEIQVSSQVATVANVVCHPYFNLAGRGTIADHVLQVCADHYLRVDDDLIPLPEAPAAVRGSFDLRGGKRLGDVIDDIGGLDHCFVADGTGLRHIATLVDPDSRRRLDIASDEPALQVYTGQKLAEASATGPRGSYPNFAAVALETQGFPNAVNRPDFPSQRLAAGEVRTRRTSWRFSRQ